MPAKKNRTSTASRSINSLVRLSLIASITLNICILILAPYHFSFISAIIAISCVLALGRHDKHVQSRSFQIGATISVIASALYTILVIYWLEKRECSGFFGAYYECMSFHNLTYGYLELIGSTFSFLAISAPLLSQMKLRKLFR